MVRRERDGKKGWQERVCFAVHYGVVRFGAVQRSVVRCGAVQRSVVRCGAAVRCNVARHGAAPYAVVACVGR